LLGGFEQAANLVVKSRKNKGPSIKTSAQNREKLTPLVVRTHHKFQKIRSLLHQKVRIRTHLKNTSSALVRKMSALDNPTPLTVDFFYGRPNFFRFTNLQVNNVRSDTLHTTIKPIRLVFIALMKSRKTFCFVAFYDTL